MPELSHLSITPKISIDTRHADVAKKALDLNVDWINDVSGLADPAMREILASQHCSVVVMHNLGIPVTNSALMRYEQDPISSVYKWGESTLLTLEKSGIARERIIFDVGIGFGNTPEQAVELIQQINVFQNLNTRLMVGHSRKSFLQQFTTLSPVERDLETVVFSLYLAKQHVDYLRIHNVDMHGRAFKVRGSIAEGAEGVKC